jgi:hypothetical protein
MRTRHNVTLYVLHCLSCIILIVFGDEYELRISLYFAVILLPECSGREAENSVVVRLLPAVNTGTVFHTYLMFLGVPGDRPDE